MSSSSYLDPIVVLRRMLDGEPVAGYPEFEVLPVPPGDFAVCFCAVIVTSGVEYPPGTLQALCDVLDGIRGGAHFNGERTAVYFDMVASTPQSTRSLAAYSLVLPPIPIPCDGRTWHVPSTCPQPSHSLAIRATVVLRALPGIRAAGQLPANANSVHPSGKHAMQAIIAARRFFAKIFLGSNDCPSDQIICTDGGSPAATLVMSTLPARPRFLSRSSRQDVVMIGATEHSAVYDQFQALRGRGFTLVTIPVRETGHVDMHALEALLKEHCDNVALVSVMHVNNETGAIQDIKAISDAVKVHCSQRALIHSDCVASFGKAPVSCAALGADLITVSAHKFHGPKRVGVLAAARTGLVPAVYKDTPCHASFAAAAVAAADTLRATESELAHCVALKERFCVGLPAISRRTEVEIKCLSGTGCIPQIVCVLVPGLQGKTIVGLIGEKGYLVSSGAACAAQKSGPSHVMVAMANSVDSSYGAVRFSWGLETEGRDVDGLLDALEQAIVHLKPALKKDSGQMPEHKQPPPALPTHELFGMAASMNPALLTSPETADLASPPLPLELTPLPHADVSPPPPRAPSVVRSTQMDRLNLPAHEVQIGAGFLLAGCGFSSAMGGTLLPRLPLDFQLGLRLLAIIGGAAGILASTHAMRTLRRRLGDMFTLQHRALGLPPTKPSLPLSPNSPGHDHHPEDPHCTSFDDSGPDYSPLAAAASKFAQAIPGNINSEDPDPLRTISGRDYMSCTSCASVPPPETAQFMPLSPSATQIPPKFSRLAHSAGGPPPIFAQAQLSYDCIMCNLGEAFLKKGNRGAIEQQMLRNMRRKFEMVKLPQLRCDLKQSWILVSIPKTQKGGEYIPKGGSIPKRNELNFPHDKIPHEVWARAAPALQRMAGVSTIMPMVFVDHQNWPAFLAKVLGMFKVAFDQIIAQNPQLDEVSFRVLVKRADKKFPKQSPQVAKEISETLVDGMDGYGPPLKGTMISFSKLHCAMGLPQGSASAVLSLLSGGFDSPVASEQVMLRGHRVHWVHFHSFPYTGEEGITKVKNICQLLNMYQSDDGLLYAVPFAKVQELIRDHAPSPYRTVLYRAYMFKIAEQIARIKSCGALVTGDNIGQVASQTLTNMSAINSVVNMLVLRPLTTWNKQDIIARSMEIDTYEISRQACLSGGTEDCCTVFQPDAPILRCAIEDLQEIMESLEGHGIQKLLDDAIDGTDVYKGTSLDKKNSITHSRSAAGNPKHVKRGSAYTPVSSSVDQTGPPPDLD
eukprot:gene1798-460_t